MHKCKCTNPNAQIQMHKCKCTNANAQLQMNKFKCIQMHNRKQSTIFPCACFRYNRRLKRRSNGVKIQGSARVITTAPTPAPMLMPMPMPMPMTTTEQPTAKLPACCLHHCGHPHRNKPQSVLQLVLRRLPCRQIATRRMKLMLKTMPMPMPMLMRWTSCFWKTIDCTCKFAQLTWKCNLQRVV